MDSNKLYSLPLAINWDGKNKVKVTKHKEMFWTVYLGFSFILLVCFIFKAIWRNPIRFPEGKKSLEFRLNWCQENQGAPCFQLHCKKNVSDIPVPRRDVTSRLGTGKSIHFFMVCKNPLRTYNNKWPGKLSNYWLYIRTASSEYITRL